MNQDIKARLGGLFLLLIGGILAAACFFWFKQQFTALGYSVGV